MELLFYNLCFKLLKTFKLLHKTVDSRDCGASEQKEGKYRRKKEYFLFAPFHSNVPGSTGFFDRSRMSSADKL